MLAVIQLRATADVAANITRAIDLVRRAAVQHNAAFVCLPEAFDYIVDTSVPVERRPQPEPISGERVGAFSKLARELKVWISLGGIHELAADGKQRNSHVILDDRGDVKAVYRKIHLFDAKVENGYKESASVTPGDEICLVRNTPVGNVGLTTCYDIRFPYMYAALRDAGADVILVPSAFTMGTGAAHWHTLLRARAIENQVYIFAAAQQGPHNPLRSSYGHSLIVDPFGEILLDLGGKDDEAIGVFQPDFERLQTVRQAMPVQDHRHHANKVLSLTVHKQSLI